MEEDNKIEIIAQPIKKIVIFDCTPLSLEEFFKRFELIAMSGQLVALNWAEGIVFFYLPYEPGSDVIIEEMLENSTTYWAGIMFASMADYQSIKKFGAREIPIIDQTSIPYLRQVAQWLKKQIRRKP